MLKRGVKPKNDISPVRNRLSDLSPLQNPFVQNMASPSIVHNNLSSQMNEFGEEQADLEVLRPLGSPAIGDYDIFTHNYNESEAEDQNMLQPNNDG